MSYFSFSQCPTIHSIAHESACKEYLLPAISGANLNNPAYYTQPNGEGRRIPAGSAITTSGIIYAFDERGGCASEKSFNVTITRRPIIRAPKYKQISYDAARFGFTIADQNGLDRTLDISADYGLTAGSIVLRVSNGRTILSGGNVNFGTSTDPNDRIRFRVTGTVPVRIMTFNANVMSGDLTSDRYEGFVANDGVSYEYGSSLTSNFVGVRDGDEHYVLKHGLNNDAPNQLWISDGPATDVSFYRSATGTINSVRIILLVEREHTACASIALPSINGFNLSGNEAYFTGINGTGTRFNPGQTISSTTSLNIYDESGSSSCSDNIPLTFTVHPHPDFTLSSASICRGAEVAIFNFNNATGLPDEYSINWNATANNAGVVDVSTTPLTGSSFSVGGLSGVVPGTYNGTLTISNHTNGCLRDKAISFTIEDNPTISLESVSAICEGESSTEVFYSSITGGANEYSIDWDLSANMAGLPDLPYTTITSSPLSITGLAGVSTGNYNGTLTIRNSATGCYSKESIGLTIHGEPEVIFEPIAPICEGDSIAMVSYHELKVANQYSIDWDSGANTAGMADVANAPLTSSPLFMTDLVHVVSGTHTGRITIRDSVTGCNTIRKLNLAINPIPVLASVSTDLTACGIDDGVISITDLSASALYAWSYDSLGVTLSGNSTSTNTGEILLGSGLRAGTYSNIFVVLNGCESDRRTEIISSPQAPVLDPISTAVVCDSFLLPTISGSNLTGNEAYYTLPNYLGERLVPGNYVSSSGTYFVLDSTVGSSSCKTEMSFDLLVNKSPVKGDLSPDLSAYCSGDQADVTLSGAVGDRHDWFVSANGTSFSSYSGSINYDTVANNVSFVNLGAVNDTTRIYVSSSTVCGAVSSDTVKIVIHPVPNAGSINNASICLGDSVELVTSGLSGNEIRWGTSATNTGFTTLSSRSSSVFVSPEIETYYRLIVSYAGSFCLPDTSNIAQVTINNTDLAGVIRVSDDSLCLGSTALLELSGHRKGSGSISWEVTQDTTGGFWVQDASSNQDTLKVLLTTTSQYFYRAIVNNAVCQDTSAHASLTVLPQVDISVGLMADAQELCQGVDAVTVSIVDSLGGGQHPSFTWSINNSAKFLGTNVSYSTDTLPVGLNTVVVEMMPDSLCASGVVTDTVKLTVKPLLNTTVYIGVEDSIKCQLDQFKFDTVTSNNLGINPSFQWQVNGAVLPSETLFSFTTQNLKDGDGVRLQVTPSPEVCTQDATRLSNEIIIEVRRKPIVGALFGAGPVCFGEEVEIGIETFSGLLEWQFSSDGVVWQKYGNSNEKVIMVTPNEIFTVSSIVNERRTYFRAVIAEDALIQKCEPVVSQNIEVNEIPLPQGEIIIINDCDNATIEVEPNPLNTAYTKFAGWQQAFPDEAFSSYEESEFWLENDHILLTNSNAKQQRFVAAYYTRVDGMEVDERCVFYDTATVDYCKPLPVDIPNTMTPNGDGSNDVFWIKNIDLYPSNTLKIYNRWGSLVYETEGYHNNWEGKNNGVSLPAAVYYYSLNLNQKDYPDSYTGTITLIK